MRLKHLWIKKYKNLNDLHINFEDNNGLTMLVGTNGSGKSNILELISQAFFDSNYGTHTPHCEYSLFYEFDNEMINIVSDRNKVYVCEYGAKTSANTFEFSYSRFIEEEWGAEEYPLFKDTDGTPNYKNISDLFFRTLEANINSNLSANQIIPLAGKLYVHVLTKLQKQPILPENIIMIYSGENFRMRKLFGKRHSKMLYVDNSFAEITLMVYMLSYIERSGLFVRDTLNISSINSIEMKINFLQIKDEYKQIFLSFQEESIVYGENTTVNINETFQEFKKRFTENFISGSTNEIEYIDALKHDEQKIFNAFVSAISNNAISDIKLIFNDNLTVGDLSEGEKRQLLLHALLEFIGYDNSLVLLDEPDAYIHESKKSEIYNLFKTLCKELGRNIILTTHSPTLVDIADENQIALLTPDESGIVSGEPFNSNKLEAIKHLTGSRLSVFSKKPIVVFEGKTDLLYIKKAIEVLRGMDERYKRIDLNFMSAGGSGNAQFLIDDLIKCIDPHVKIYVFFDRDDAGEKGAARVLGIKQSDVNINKRTTITRGNLTVGFIPFKQGVTSGDFLIEDYFTKAKVEEEIRALFPRVQTPIKSLPNLSSVKEKLEAHYMQYEDGAFLDFKELVNILLKIQNEEV